MASAAAFLSGGASPRSPFVTSSTPTWMPTHRASTTTSRAIVRRCANSGLRVQYWIVSFGMPTVSSARVTPSTTAMPTASARCFAVYFRRVAVMKSSDQGFEVRAERGARFRGGVGRSGNRRIFRSEERGVITIAVDQGHTSPEGSRAGYRKRIRHLPVERGGAPKTQVRGVQTCCKSHTRDHEKPHRRRLALS